MVRRRVPDGPCDPIPITVYILALKGFLSRHFKAEIYMLQCYRYMDP